MLQEDLGNHCPLSPNNFGMVLRVYNDAQLKTL